MSAQAVNNGPYWFAKPQNRTEQNVGLDECLNNSYHTTKLQPGHLDHRLLNIKCYEIDPLAAQFTLNMPRVMNQAFVRWFLFEHIPQLTLHKGV